MFVSLPRYSPIAALRFSGRNSLCPPSILSAGRVRPRGRISSLIFSGKKFRKSDILFWRLQLETVAGGLNLPKVA
jgi:hypothetical protein